MATFDAAPKSYYSGDSDSENSSDSDGHVKLGELYALPEVTNEIDEYVQPKRKRSGQDRERMPTRRPDPNVFNRNALLARENRRKKKVHLETLESALQECKRVNAVLLDELKRQRKTTRRLEREKLYYKNIVTNQTDILSLVSALNGRLRESVNSTPHSSSVSLCQTSPTRDSLYSYSGSSNYEPEYQSYNFEYSDNEFERPNPAIDETWNELLHDKDFGLAADIVEPQTSETDTKNQSNINREHSYVAQSQEADETLKNVTGVCLHIAGGKVSLEFCPTCHFNSNNNLPPNQLLQEEEDV